LKRSSSLDGLTSQEFLEIHYTAIFSQRMIDLLETFGPFGDHLALLQDEIFHQFNED
jgi:hypothetical protein